MIEKCDEKISSLFLEKLIPLFERWFGDEWVQEIDYSVRKSSFTLRLPNKMAKEKLLQVRDAITAWFGDLLTHMSGEPKLHRIAVTFQTEDSGAMATA